MQNQIRKAREESSKMFMYLAGGIYLLNGLFATFGGGNCPLGLPAMFDPIVLAWLWSLPVLGIGVLFAYKAPTATFTRHLLTFVIGALCTLTPDVMPLGFNGVPLRIEGHFIFFAALVYLAMALDIKVLLNFAVLVGIGHTVLGIYAPMCIYGVPQASITRALLHAGFIGLEVLGLLYFIRQRMSQLSERVEAIRYHEQVDLFSIFITRLPVAVVMTDLNMKILAVSEEWLDRFGVEDHNVVGKSYYDVLNVSDKWKANHQLVLKEGHSFIYHDDTIILKGKTEYVNRRLVPWFSKGKVAGLIAVTRFLTNEVTARRELDRIHSQVDELEAAKAVLIDNLEKRRLAQKAHFKAVSLVEKASVDAAALVEKAAVEAADLVEKAIAGISTPEIKVTADAATLVRKAASVAADLVRKAAADAATIVYAAEQDASGVAITEAKENLEKSSLKVDDAVSDPNLKELEDATSDSAAATIASAAATKASTAATNASEAATVASEAAKENLQRSLDQSKGKDSNGETNANTP